MRGSKEIYEELQSKLSYETQCIEDGRSNVLDGLIELESDRYYLEKHLNDIKEFKNEYQNEIENEAKEHQSEYKGYKIEVRSGRKTFNYKGIKAIDEKEAELKQLKETAKQAFLSSQKGMMIASEDGEEIQLPKISYSASSVILKEIK